MRGTVGGLLPRVGVFSGRGWFRACVGGVLPLALGEGGVGEAHVRGVLYLFESVEVELPDEAAELVVAEIVEQDLFLKFFFIENVDSSPGFIEDDDFVEFLTLSDLASTLRMALSLAMKLLGLFSNIIF